MTSEQPYNEKYDEFTTIHLTDPDTGSIPLRAHLCLRCGSVAVDMAVHDRWHAELSDPTSRK